MNSANKRAVKRFQGTLPDKIGKYQVLDVGSQCVEGQFQGNSLWPCSQFDYWGVDIAQGCNVDQVVNKGSKWDLGRRFDVVACLSCLEHCERPWELMETMSGHLVEGGYLIAVAPFSFIEHRYPVDCYRYLPDGMKALAKYAGLEVVEAYIEVSRPWHGEWSERLGWCISMFYRGTWPKETVLIARKLV